MTIISGLVFIQSPSSQAGVKGPCSNCHTMHNSQDGAFENEVDGDKINAQSFLIKGANLSDKNPCLGCHCRNADGRHFQDPTKVNPDNPDENIDAPQVNVNLKITDGEMSAAGTFYYVIKDAPQKDANTNTREDPYQKSCRKGHNVIGVGDAGNDNVDELFQILGRHFPPGGTEDCVPLNDYNDQKKQLACAGASGCHGDRKEPRPMVAIKGGHHSSLTSRHRPGTKEGEKKIANAYRMLYGVKGLVAKNWEYGKHDEILTSLNSDTVNIYQGTNGTDKGLDGDKTWPGDDGSINGLCAECHGCSKDTTGNGFHSLAGLNQDGKMESPWKRHPTDFVMKGAAYGAYPGDNGKYSQEVPVGFATITESGPINESERVVLCISCHRPHGSQYDDALRWDYNDMKTNSPNGNGCFRCHTDKYNSGQP